MRNVSSSRYEDYIKYLPKQDFFPIWFFMYCYIKGGTKNIVFFLLQINFFSRNTINEASFKEFDWCHKCQLIFINHKCGYSKKDVTFMGSS